MKKTLFVYVLIALFALPACSQIAKADPPPGKMQLLPGYTHKSEQGIDTRVGKIFKNGGITINYDIGELAGLYTSPDGKDEYEWYKEQKMNTQTVRIALTKKRELRVTFVEATVNFFGTVPTEQDLADALLMVLTF
jgi:hypothetical protein